MRLGEMKVSGELKIGGRRPLSRSDSFSPRAVRGDFSETPSAGKSTRGVREGTL